METAILGRLTLSPNTVFNPKPGPCINRGILMAISTTGPGIVKKLVIQRTTPGRESEFDFEEIQKNIPTLSYNKREYVVQVLMKVIPGMTVDNAVNIMQEAYYNGLAVVIICAQAGC